MPDFILSADHPSDPAASIHLHIDAPDLPTSYDLAFDLVTTYRLLGTMLRSDTVNHYLFTYYVGTCMVLSSIQAATISEAEACLSALAESGIITCVSG